LIQANNNVIFVSNQVGGNHYQNMAIQPWEYSIRNNIPWAEGEVIKYVSRWRDKGGIEDLRKAKSILERLIEVALADGEPKPAVKHPPIVEYTLTESELKGLD
jgi:hypothetical protein